MWHLCLGYINLNRIQKLVKSKTSYSLVPKNLLVCEYCIKGKMIKRSFIATEVRAKECLELMHPNVYEPFNVHARGGHEYCIIFVDD